MAINLKKYVNIVSGVAGASLVELREYIARSFTTNTLLPSSVVGKFPNATEVGDYFGTESEEFKRAQVYFSFISKSISTPQSISFGRWVATDSAPLIFGKKNIITSLAEFQAIADGAFTLTIGVETNDIDGLDFTSALTLADVATVIETEIQLQVGAMWTGATVLYSATTNSFNFVGGDLQPVEISVADAGSGTEIKDLIGWGFGAIFAEGALQETLTETLEKSTNISNDFGSFVFQSTLTNTQHEEIATWNKLQNVMYIYHKPGTIATAATDYSALGHIGGTVNTITEITGEYPIMYVMAVQAATRYDKPNSVVNYMFQIFPTITSSVQDSATAELLDGVSANYYGNTQTAGKLLSFYQNGVMYGTSADPLDINTYANEIWLKDAAAVTFMQLFLASEKVSANNQGRIRLITALQTVINKAVDNGVISVGKLLTDSQKSVIQTISDDDDAWRQVQDIGYWRNVEIRQVGSEFVAFYTLIYAKDDDVRKVEGQHVLI